jgi:hypothetical protein
MTGADKEESRETVALGSELSAGLGEEPDYHHAICVGVYTKPKTYHFTANFCGFGVRETLMSHEEYEVINAVILRMFKSA